MRIKYLSFGFVLLLFSCGDSESSITPTRKTITASVYGSVTVQPDSLYQVHAVVSGILDKNLVEEGDSVRRGQPLIELINSTPILSAENARLAMELAQKNYQGEAALLASIQDEIHAASITFKNDSINCFRQKRLWADQIGTKAELDNRELTYQLSRNKLNLLQNNYQRTKNELEMQLDQAKNNYASSKIVQGDFTVASKIDGTVYAVYKNPGEMVTSRDALAAVGSSNDFIIELLIDETDIVKVAQNQKVLVTLDAYQEEIFEAYIHKIYPRKDERSQTFKVEALFKEPPMQLYPGLSGEGNILVAVKEDALVIPKVYVFDTNKVLTTEGSKVVTLGLQNLDQVEVLHGIDATTQLLKPE